jgi:hypothetical protein
LIIKQSATNTAFTKLVLLIALLFIQLHSYEQIDQAKVDSLAKLIDSSAKAYKTEQDSIVKRQDSVYKLEAQKMLQKNQNNHSSLPGQGRRAMPQQIVACIVACILLLLIAIVALKRRRKPRS